MVKFSRHILSNGLRVLIHRDESTPMAAVSLLYNVGSKNESPDKTGFAHLFEHLMFSGTPSVPDYDAPVQNAGGENNAFTNSDITNFYNIVPVENLETIFYLESDRMESLQITPKKLAIQQKVVVEEFKETCLNVPYGDSWHNISNLAYQKHPYSWPTIGKIPEHVEQAKLEEVQAFFENYYCPNNAILVVAGNVEEEKVMHLVNKWFAEIPRGAAKKSKIPKEPYQDIYREFINQNEVPARAVNFAFHSPGRLDLDYHASDLLSDLLCNGGSSRLYRKLLKEQKSFNQIDAYISGSVDPGLLIIEGRPSDHVSLEKAEALIWEEIEKITAEGISEKELQKLKNKIESVLVFSEMSVLNKAMNLAYFEMLGDGNWINEEVSKYRAVTTTQFKEVANKILKRSNCSKVVYTNAVE